MQTVNFKQFGIAPDIGFKQFNTAPMKGGSSSKTGIIVFTIIVLLIIAFYIKFTSSDNEVKEYKEYN